MPVFTQYRDKLLSLNCALCG